MVTWKDVFFFYSEDSLEACLIEVKLKNIWVLQGNDKNTLASWLLNGSES